jgi:hypothetical protein
VKASERRVFERFLPPFEADFHVFLEYFGSGITTTESAKKCILLIYCTLEKTKGTDIPIPVIPINYFEVPFFTIIFITTYISINYIINRGIWIPHFLIGITGITGIGMLFA